MQIVEITNRKVISNKSYEQDIIISCLSLTNCLFTFLIYMTHYDTIENKYEFLSKLIAYFPLFLILGFVIYIKQVVYKYMLVYFSILLIVSWLFENDSIVFFVLKYFSAIGLISTHVAFISDINKQA